MIIILRTQDNSIDNYHILSVGGGGMLTASVPRHSCTSTVSSRGVLDISSIFFLMNSVSVAFWKYLDLAILSTKRMILLGRWPPTYLSKWGPRAEAEEEEEEEGWEAGSESESSFIHNSISQLQPWRGQCECVCVIYNISSELSKCVGSNEDG